MKKFLTKRNAIIGTTLAAVLISGVSLKALADDHVGKGITLDSMLEKTGERFDATDADGNGVVTQAEADTAKAATQAEFSERMGERLASMFERMDSDGDGIVSEGDRGYGRLADRFDLEGDLTLEQLQTAASDKMAARMADRQAELGDEAPTYPQTRDQALADAEARFASLDTNGDGTLSRDEVPGRGFGHGKGHGGDRGDRVSNR